MGSSSVAAAREGGPVLPVSVELFDRSRHLEGLIGVVERSSRDLLCPYPPARGAAAVQDGDTRGWALEPGHAGHWVATSQGVVLASARLDSPGEYLSGFLPARSRFVEVRRVVVDPAVRGRSVARQLMPAPLGRARELRCGVALAVFDYLPVARRLYESLGFCPVGSFVGPNGLTHVLVLEQP